MQFAKPLPTGQTITAGFPAAGSYRDKLWPDGWTAVTVDGKRSAQFEHTVVITQGQAEILTARLPTSPKLWWELEE